MIIICEECTTRFQLDDERIPDKGAKVRCSKCKHAFFVKPETRSGDPVENLVSQVLAADEAGASTGSSPSDDPGSAGSLRSDDPGSTGSLRPDDDQTAQEAIDDFEESDWEFNTESTPEDSDQEASQYYEPIGIDLAKHDGAALGLDDAAAGETLPDLDDAAAGETLPDLDDGPAGEMLPDLDDVPDVESSLGLAAESASEIETASGPAVDAAQDTLDGLLGDAADASDDVDELFDTTPGVDHGIDGLLDRGSSDSVGLLAESEPQTAPVASPDVAAEAIGADPVGSARDDLGPAGEAHSGARRREEAAGSREELGAPNDWDFFGGEAETAPSPGYSQPIVVGRIGASAGVGAEARIRPPMEVEAESNSMAVWSRPAAQAVGWAAVTMLALAIVHQALWSPLRVAPPVPHWQEVGGFVASSLEGRWVENAIGGTLYVISGELRSSGTARPPGTRVAVRLLDASGAVLADAAAVLGPELSEALLREEAPAALQRRQAEAAFELAGRRLSTAHPLRFDAVLDDVPAAAARFDLVALPVTAPPPAGIEPAQTPTEDASPVQGGSVPVAKGAV